MENSDSAVESAAYKLEFGQVIYGNKIAPIWVYSEVPQGMRPAKLKDLRYGNAVLHQVQIGPDAGKYYSAFVTPATYWILKGYIDCGVPVFIPGNR